MFLYVSVVTDTVGASENSDWLETFNGLSTKLVCPFSLIS